MLINSVSSRKVILSYFTNILFISKTIYTLHPWRFKMASSI